MISATAYRHHNTCLKILGGLWLLDGLLQLQPAQWSGGPLHDALAGSLGMLPVNLHAPVNLSLAILAVSPAFCNLAVAVVQLVIGLALLGGRYVRPALALSIGWAACIWLVGEGLGGILTGTATDPSAAPVYALFALALWNAPGSAESAGPANSNALTKLPEVARRIEAASLTTRFRRHAALEHNGSRRVSAEPDTAPERLAARLESLVARPNKV